MFFFLMNDEIVHLAEFTVAAHTFSNAFRSMNIGFMAINMTLFCEYFFAKLAYKRHTAYSSKYNLS